MSDKKTVGTIHNKDSLFLRIDGGTADSPQTGKFELAVNMGSSTPIIRSERTGKWFSLSWEDIIRLGIDAGILEEGP